MEERERENSHGRREEEGGRERERERERGRERRLFGPAIEDAQRRRELAALVREDG